MRLVQQRHLWVCKIVDTNESDVLEKIAFGLKKQARTDDSCSLDTENNDDDMIFGD